MERRTHLILLAIGIRVTLRPQVPTAALGGAPSIIW